jgi:hypothetical protein
METRVRAWCCLDLVDVVPMWKIGMQGRVKGLSFVWRRRSDG